YKEVLSRLLASTQTHSRNSFSCTSEILLVASRYKNRSSFSTFRNTSASAFSRQPHLDPIICPLDTRVNKRLGILFFSFDSYFGFPRIVAEKAFDQTIRNIR